MADRSTSPEVRNPVLALKSVQKIGTFPPEMRTWLADLLHEASLECRVRANECWRRHKAPMAVYWKGWSVYFRHVARVVRP